MYKNVLKSSESDDNKRLKEQSPINVGSDAHSHDKFVY